VLAEGLPATLGGPTGQYPTGASAAVVAGDAFYYIVGEYRGTPASTLYALGVGADSTPVRVAGGLGRDGFPATAISNPYDLVAHPEDGFLISDGGRNALLWARESGDVEELVRFERRPHPDEQMRHRIDVVPSGITFGPDGALYMASFTGNPYQRGFAVVYRITGIEGGGRPRAEVHAEGFSFATDVAFAPDGSMLVTEFTSDMARLVAEYGMDGAEELPGRLVRWHEGTMDVLVEGLVTPTGLAVVGDNAYVSEEYAGRIRKIPLDGLGR
ncbi:MAG: ScyD/ScyE family protein, partial [Dehalococcoidia bacterium]